ncbi:hypothetical protein NM688_g4197 [Phlebia brevispora]|uniref:Uncharacterized protein n=1 Tax=Phlebia brevispora TaxID=194682 RepID=A0ACC1T3R6_9APHY|nr:hypothetical protein NM688_g4197 [Phlebia brevispora]
MDAHRILTVSKPSQWTCPASRYLRKSVWMVQTANNTHYICPDDLALLPSSPPRPWIRAASPPSQNGFRHIPSRQNPPISQFDRSELTQWLTKYTSVTRSSSPTRSWTRAASPQFQDCPKRLVLHQDA